MRNRSWLRTLALVCTLAVGGSAQAANMTIEDSSTHDRAMHADVFVLGGFFGYLHFGVGGWFAYPIMPDGFLPTLNDAFFIEAGGAVERYSWNWGSGITDCNYAWWRATPLGGVRWSFYLTPDWTVYGTAKIGYAIGFADSVDCGGITGASTPNWSYPAFDAAVGAHWNISPDWSLRFELGYFGASVGAGMDIGGTKQAPSAPAPAPAPAPEPDKKP